MNSSYEKGMELLKKLHGGHSGEEIVEMIVMMSIYAGFPAAVNALLIAKEVF